MCHWKWKLDNKLSRPQRVHERTADQWRRQLLKVGGQRESGGRRSTSGVQGQSSGGGLGWSPQKLKQYANLKCTKPSYICTFTLFGVHAQYWLGLAYTTNHYPNPHPLQISHRINGGFVRIWKSGMKRVGATVSLLPPPPWRRHCCRLPSQRLSKLSHERGCRRRRLPNRRSTTMRACP